MNDVIFWDWISQIYFFEFGLINSIWTNCKTPSEIEKPFKLWRHCDYSRVFNFQYRWKLQKTFGDIAPPVYFNKYKIHFEVQTLQKNRSNYELPVKTLLLQNYFQLIIQIIFIILTKNKPESFSAELPCFVLQRIDIHSHPPKYKTRKFVRVTFNLFLSHISENQVILDDRIDFIILKLNPWGERFFDEKCPKTVIYCLL